MIDTSVSFQGTIAEVPNIREPYQDFFTEVPLYRLAVMPMIGGNGLPGPYYLEELEGRIEQLRETLDAERERTIEKGSYQYEHKEELIKRTEIYSSTIHTPRLCKRLKEYSHDEQFLYERVDFLGNIQMLPNGNMYISCHSLQLVDEWADWVDQ